VYTLNDRYMNKALGLPRVNRGSSESVVEFIYCCVK
jgi:hypothetical protein